MGLKDVAAAPAADRPEDFVQAAAASAAFAKAPALRKLLLYLWEHRDAPISEYSIALDVFGKREDFDPKTDATVRVHVSRLRQKLKEYYETEGNGHATRLVVPTGAHRLELLEAPKPAAVSRMRQLSLRWGLPLVASALVVSSAWLWSENRQLRRELSRVRRAVELPELWQSVLRPGQLTRIIYPIPVFYQWDKLRVRDVMNNDPEGWRTSPSLQGLVERFGRPTLSVSYSVASDTQAVIQLTRFLSDHGVPIEVTATGSLSLDKYGTDNLIFLGIPPTNAALSKYTDRTNFYLLAGHGAIGNRRPQAGEPAEFRSPRRDDGGMVRETRYGVLAVLPGHAPGTSLMLLTGLHTASLSTFATSPLSIPEFESTWRRHGKPAYFEAVIEAETDGQATKKARIAAFRAIR